MHTALQPDDSDVAEKAYTREINNQSDCVHTIDKHRTLEKLKEAVAIYHWSKEAFANELQI